VSEQSTRSATERLIAAVKSYVGNAFTRANPRYAELLDRVETLERRLAELEQR
jgi:hypothetical protein